MGRMELLEVFISSLLIGLSIAAPVGPIGMLTLQRSLDQGTRAGLATGLVRRRRMPSMARLALTA